MPRMKKTRQITRKRKKRNFAMPAAVDAIPVNPNYAAASAITKKIKAQRNILLTSGKRIVLAPGIGLGFLMLIEI
jgi:hypothetical protein